MWSQCVHTKVHLPRPFSTLDLMENPLFPRCWEELDTGDNCPLLPPGPLITQNNGALQGVREGNRSARCLAAPASGVLILPAWLLSCSVVSNPLQSHRLQPTRLLHPWNSPGKNTGAGCHFTLLGIFLTQGFQWPSWDSNLHFLCLLHWQGDSLKHMT